MDEAILYYGEGLDTIVYHIEHLTFHHLAEDCELTFSARYSTIRYTVNDALLVTLFIEWLRARGVIIDSFYEALEDSEIYICPDLRGHDDVRELALQYTPHVKHVVILVLKLRYRVPIRFKLHPDKLTEIAVSFLTARGVLEA